MKEAVALRDIAEAQQPAVVELISGVFNTDVDLYVFGEVSRQAFPGN